jgi:hypothetical protein
LGLFVGGRLRAKGVGSFKIISSPILSIDISAT